MKTPAVKVLSSCGPMLAPGHIEAKVWRYYMIHRVMVGRQEFSVHGDTVKHFYSERVLRNCPTRRAILAVTAPIGAAVCRARGLEFRDGSVLA